MKTRIRTDELMQPIATFSHATQAGGVIHLGATAGTDSQRRLAGVRPGLCDVEIQIEKMLANVVFVLFYIVCFMISGSWKGQPEAYSESYICFINVSDKLM